MTSPNMAAETARRTRASADRRLPQTRRRRPQLARGQQSPNLRAFTYAAIADRDDHTAPPEHSERVTRTALGDPAEGRGRP